MFIKKISVLFIAVLLFSCADPSIFDDNSSDIAVYTVKSGGLQEYGTPLKVTLDYGKESPEFDILEISLFSASGIILSKESISSVNVESRKSREITLPEGSEKGIYHIKIRLLKSGLEIREETRSFFYDNDEYRLENIKSYPPDPVPGEKIILKADYTSPVSSDPWFRWTVDDETVSEGFASENGNTAVLDLLPSNGVLSVAAEMFPFKPADSGFEEFISFFRSESAVFVSDKNRERNNEFEDSSNYLMLFHFRGEIIDEGYTALNYPGKTSVSVEGLPELDFKNSFYGYSLDRDEAVTVNYDINPFEKRLPMTLRMRFLPDREKMMFSDPGGSGYPLIKAGNHGGSSISVGLKNSSGFYINIETDSDDFEGECEYIPHGGSEVLDLAVNFYPGLTETDIVWIVNGISLKTDTVPFRISLAEGSGIYCRIGGADMLVDEAGIYTKNNEGSYSVDSSLFSSVMKNRYNGDFTAADGFDYSVSDYKAENGGCRYESGFLNIDPESSAAVFNDLELYDPVEIRTEGEADLIIKDSSGSIILESPVSGKNPVNFDPSDSVGSVFNIYLANSSSKNTIKIDNILITVRYPDTES